MTAQSLVYKEPLPRQAYGTPPRPAVRAEAQHIAAAAIEKSYRKGQHKISVLRGVNIEARKGEFLSIIGQSGSGKSTLLHLLGLLDTPDVGEVLLDGQRLDDLPGRTRDQLRNRVFGFIFQFYHLLPELTLLENALAPLMIRYSAWDFWKRRREFRDRACEIIALVGLEHRLKHRPSEMSGGEMQRAAIARALVARPEILLADEPTGNLDTHTGAEILALIRDLHERLGATVLIVTHDLQVAESCARLVALRDGRIEEDRAGKLGLAVHDSAQAH
jgi:lipoprotein-releasing system ATP-binding protein